MIMCGKFFLNTHTNLHIDACRRTINLFNLIIRCFAFSMEREREERKGVESKGEILCCVCEGKVLFFGMFFFLLAYFPPRLPPLSLSSFLYGGCCGKLPILYYILPFYHV
jgi:hypothetical protein